MSGVRGERPTGLPRTYRWVLRGVSQSGQTSSHSATVTARRWRFVDGVKEYDSEQTELNETFVHYDNNVHYKYGSAVDNSSGKWEGADVTCTITINFQNSGTATMAILFQASPDGGVTWATDDDNQRPVIELRASDGTYTMNAQIQ